MLHVPALAPSHAPADDWLDRRAALRLAIGPETSCHLVAAVGETYWPARVLDLSARGVRLTLRRRFEPGMHVLVESAIGRRVFSRAVVLRITHLTERNEGSFVLGGEFARKLTHDELMALLS